MSEFLKVCDLKVVARSGRLILDVPELGLAAGATLGIQGASGAGKSTLLKALMGRAERTEGEIHWGDTDLLSLRAPARARFRAERIGVIFQDYLLFDELSAPSNAGIQALFRPRSERREIARAAQGLLETVEITEEKRPVASFSGGERQRVALARALAHRPDIILADEPTASLPAVAGAALIDTLLGEVRARDATLIVVSHDSAVLTRMESVVTLDHGRLAT
ncbi:MAG: ATP-binding cassette domain-containing protein [Pseudomonadota bacterium]